MVSILSALLGTMSLGTAALYPKWAHLFTRKGSLGGLGFSVTIAPLVLFILIVLGEALLAASALWLLLALNGLALSAALLMQQKR